MVLVGGFMVVLKRFNCSRMSTFNLLLLSTFTLLSKIPAGHFVLSVASPTVVEVTCWLGVRRCIVWSGIRVLSLVSLLPSTILKKIKKLISSKSVMEWMYHV